MKIALIFGNYERQGFYPLGIMYLASYLREYSEIDVDIKLYDVFPALDELINGEYDIIGFSCLTIQFPRVNRYASDLKEKYNGIIIAGGIHFSLLRQLPDWADSVILGEGEVTFKEFVESIYYNRGMDYESLKKIDGLIFRKGENIVKTNPRGFIKNLDEIPNPARDLVDMNEYLKPNNVFGTRIGRGLGMMTSRGCVFNCEFCSTAETWGTPRFHSAQYVANEIKKVYDMYKVEYIYFEDDNFCGNYSRLVELADIMERMNLPIEFGASGRIEFINEKTIELYKRIGIKAISFGLETGSDRMLKKIKDLQNLTVEQELEKVKMVVEAGIEVHGMFMINMPGETKEDMLMTKKVIQDTPFAKIAISLASPYFGTKWWNIAVEQGIVPQNPNDNFWDLYDMHSLAGDERPLFVNEVPRDEAIRIYEEICEIARARWNYDWRRRILINDGKHEE